MAIFFTAVPMASTLGADLRALRKRRNLTLSELAARVQKSVGWLSQVERDISSPSTRDLEQFAAEFDVPLSLFFGAPEGPHNETGLIVRSGNRRELGEREDGLIEALLSPDLTDSFEVIHSTFLPGASRDEDIRRNTEEIAYLVSGQLDLWLDGEIFHLNAGDSVRIRNQTYRWSNPYNQPAVAVWVISPPVY